MRAEARPLPSVAGTWVVMRRELRALLQDRRSLSMMVIFGIVFPIILAVGATGPKNGVGYVVGIMTEVLLFPYIAGLQAALTAFVGEREHGTLGPLLATPLSNVSIFAGKLLGAAYIPSFAASGIGLGIFLAVIGTTNPGPVREIGGGAMAQLIAIAIVAGFAMIVLGLLVGSKAKSVRGAQGVSTVVVLPVIVGVQVLASSVTHRGPAFSAAILGGLFAAIVLGLVFSARIWNREEALVSLG